MHKKLHKDAHKDVRCFTRMQTSAQNCTPIRNDANKCTKMCACSQRCACVFFESGWDQDSQHLCLYSCHDIAAAFCLQMKQVLFQLLDAMVEQCKVPCPEDIEEEEEEKDE